MLAVSMVYNPTILTCYRIGERLENIIICKDIRLISILQYKHDKCGFIIWPDALYNILISPTYHHFTINIFFDNKKHTFDEDFLLRF